MSDSGSDSSSDGYEGHRGRAVTPEGSPTAYHKSQRTTASRKSSESSSMASSPCEKTPCSPMSNTDTQPKSPLSPPSPPRSPQTPNSPRSPASPDSPPSPASHTSSRKSQSDSPKSYRSGNSIDSPRSSVCDIENREKQLYRSGPVSPKSPCEPRVSPKSFASGPRSPASPKSDSDSPKSPQSGRSSVKSNLSGRSTSKSFKSGPASIPDDENKDDDAKLLRMKKNKTDNDKRRKSFTELDGEQISDGDIDDEELEKENKKQSSSVTMTHGEDLSDVSDLDSLDCVNDVETNDTPRESSECDKSPQKIAENDNKKIDKDEIIVPLNITEDSEQLDFEAEGQWKDEREEIEGEAVASTVETKEPVKDNQEKNEEKESPSKANNDKDCNAKNNTKAAVTKESGELNDDEDDDGEVNDKEDGEKVESELEEGELSDGDDARPEETEPRPVCRFYSRGQCTWGVSCRFLHPGVTDKGNYTMFDMVRPMAYPPHSAPTPHEFRPHVERPSLIRPLTSYPSHPHPPKTEELQSESAWERGLRHAKEMMRKANKRKENDMDFEEKKMNLSLGQDELEREAGYYVKPASPELPNERWPIAPKEMSRRFPPQLRGSSPDRYDDPDGYYPPSGGIPPPPPSSSAADYYRRVQYKNETRPGPDYRERPDYHGVPQRGVAHSVSPPPYPPRERDREQREREQRGYYEKYEKKQKRPTREVIVERLPPQKTWREDEQPPMERGRGDEWADPWMRRKSPTTVRRTTTTTSTTAATNSTRRSRRQSYSSGSSYSSSSSSRSSSRSSYSSYDSLSRSPSPTPSNRTRGHVKGKHPPPSPPPVNSTSSSQSRGTMLMNPPAPSPRGSKGTTSPTTVALHRRAGLNPPAPSPLVSQRHHEKTREKQPTSKNVKGRSWSRKLSSHSSSGSESSGSSSDSSESSYSSSSSVDVKRRKVSSPPLPPPPASSSSVASSAAVSQSRKETTKHTESMKINSNSKQHAKIQQQKNVNITPVKKSDRSAGIAGKKRPLEPSPSSESKASVAALAAKAAKKASSRREELLKQLKAVEDAIARKRSKPEIAGKN